MKGNIHKKLTFEGKFVGYHYCQRTQKFLTKKNKKKENNKKFRKILKAEIRNLHNECED